MHCLIKMRGFHVILHALFNHLRKSKCVSDEALKCERSKEMNFKQILLFDSSPSHLPVTSLYSPPMVTCIRRDY
jgi:hypothetical protein